MDLEESLARYVANKAYSPCFDDVDEWEANPDRSEEDFPHESYKELANFYGDAEIALDFIKEYLVSDSVVEYATEAFQESGDMKDVLAGVLNDW